MLLGVINNRHMAEEPQKRNPGALILAIVLLAGALIGGYFWGKSEGSKNSNTASDSNSSSSDTASNSDSNGLGSVSVQNNNQDPIRGNQPAVLGTETGSSNNSSGNASGSTNNSVNTSDSTTLKTYSNGSLGFTVNIPDNWTVQNSGTRVTISAPSGARYTIQSYAVTSQDIGQLKTFLASQQNLTNIQNSTFGNAQALNFQTTGFYRQGYAVLANGKVYYLIGSDSHDPKNSSLTTFSAI